MERLSESKALEIIKLETKRQATLNKRIDLKIWELKSGEIISSVRDNYYILYENNSEFKKIWPKKFFKLHVTDALYKKNPYGKSLPRYFRSLILDLFKALEYKKQKILYNDKFLNELDSLYSAIPNKKIFNEMYLLNIVAFFSVFISKKFELKIKWKYQKLIWKHGFP